MLIVDDMGHSESEDRYYALKTLANKRDVPYQSLLKIFLAERVAAERKQG